MTGGPSAAGPATGVGFCGALTIAFVVLRLTGVIGWPWWVVLTPMWVPPVLALAVMSVFGLAYLGVTVLAHHPGRPDRDVRPRRPR